jgi:hypothetical protein
MNFYDLATKLESRFNKKMNEATTMGAISYLPTQVGVVKSAIHGLKKKKDKWNLEIREDENSRVVRFEDELEIQVPKEHWDSFQEMFDSKLRDNSYLEFSVPLDDSIDMMTEDKVLTRRLDELKLRVGKIYSHPAFQTAMGVVERWKANFQGDDILDESIAVFNLASVSRSLDEVLDNFTEDVDDLGHLDMLIQALDESSLQHGSMRLAGARIHSSYNDVEMIFEVSLGSDQFNMYSIKFSDDEVVDSLEEAVVGLRRVGNVIFPRGGMLDERLGSDNLLNIIQTVIDDLGEKDEQK